MYAKLPAIALPVAAIVMCAVLFRGATATDYAVKGKLYTPEQVSNGKILNPTWAVSIIYEGTPDIIPCSKAAHDILNVGDPVEIVTVTTPAGVRVRRLAVEPGFMPPPLYKN